MPPGARGVGERVPPSKRLGHRPPHPVRAGPAEALRPRPWPALPDPQRRADRRERALPFATLRGGGSAQASVCSLSWGGVMDRTPPLGGGAGRRHPYVETGFLSKGWEPDSDPSAGPGTRRVSAGDGQGRAGGGRGGQGPGGVWAPHRLSTCKGGGSGRTHPLGGRGAGPAFRYRPFVCCPELACQPRCQRPNLFFFAG